MSASGLPVQLTVPSDPKFRSIMLTMACRIAESVGLPRRDAEAFGDEVATHASATARDAAAGADVPLDLTFEIAGPRLLARVTCRGASFEVTRALPGV